MANLPPSHYPDIGVLGEYLVAQWLQTRGWIILHHRWRCRWGEIDLVAKLDLHLGEAGGAGGAEGAEGESAFKFLDLKAGIWHKPPPQPPQPPQPPDLSSSLSPLASRPSPLMAFVEVKTRSQNNWDAGGLLAITPKKQAKLRQTAQCFLTTYPDLAQYPCRFDVGLVSYQISKNQSGLSKSSISIEAATSLSSMSIQLGQSITIGNYQLLLQEYLPSAFD